MVVVIDPDPVAGAAFIPTTNICPGVTVQFDGSMSLAATGYSWTFPQGNPSSASSGIATPAISFGLSGHFSQITFDAANMDNIVHSGDPDLIGRQTAFVPDGG